MAKAGAAGLTPLRVRAVRAFLEAAGDTAVASKHQHLKLRHPARPPVLLPRRPQTVLSFGVAIFLRAIREQREDVLRASLLHIDLLHPNLSTASGKHILEGLTVLTIALITGGCHAAIGAR